MHINTRNLSDEQIASTIEYHIIEKIKILLSKLKANMIINNTQVEKFLQHPYIEKSDKNVHFAIYGESYFPVIHTTKLLQRSKS